MSENFLGRPRADIEEDSYHEDILSSSIQIETLPRRTRAWLYELQFLIGYATVPISAVLCFGQQKYRAFFLLEQSKYFGGVAEMTQILGVASEARAVGLRPMSTVNRSYNDGDGLFMQQRRYRL